MTRPDTASPAHLRRMAAQPQHRPAGLGPAATFTLLGCFAAPVLVAAASLPALLYVAPPAAAGRGGGPDPGRRGAARPAGACSGCAGGTAPTPATPATAPRSSLHHTGILQLPGTLAADRAAVRRGRLRRPVRPGPRPAHRIPDRHPAGRAGLDLAGRPRRRRPVGRELGRLAGLARLPARGALGHGHRRHRARPRHRRSPTRSPPRSTPRRPAAALEIMDQLVAAAPAAAADVDTRVSITFDPAAMPAAAREPRRGGHRDRPGAARPGDRRSAPAG